MKRNKKELDVDFIGGHSPLTNEEAHAISEYIKSKKSKTTRRKLKTTTSKRKKVTS